jgi:hypothetical protein
MSGFNYFSNFDDSQFKAYENIDSTRLYSDPCAILQKNEANAKKLKFVTTNHIDLLEAKDKLNFYGMTIKDKLFVPSDNIDSDSFLRYGKTGGILTNVNVKNIFGQLPVPTMPARYQSWHGDVVVEDSIRINPLPNNKNSCNPHDINYHNRSFYIFNDQLGIETPNAINSVETKNFGPRGGINTRFMYTKKQ